MKKGSRFWLVLLICVCALGMATFVSIGVVRNITKAKEKVIEFFSEDVAEDVAEDIVENITENITKNTINEDRVDIPDDTYDMEGAEGSDFAESTNTERTTTERVFDYADKLTDLEEESLRVIIHEVEKETQCDIVLVTLNESLVEYAAQYEEQIGKVPISKCVMVYADNFYDEHKFGYDKPYGDGVLLLDNWYCEEDGWIYNWLTTSGRAMECYSSERIEKTINEVNSLVDTKPYDAYVSYVLNVRECMLDDFNGAW